MTAVYLSNKLGTTYSKNFTIRIMKKDNAIILGINHKLEI